MAEEYGWCKDLPVVDYREKGKHYCVFHAPEGKKGIQVKEFNELIFKRIKETNENELCDLSGTIFEGDIDINFRYFADDSPIPEINFRGATFSGEVSFFGTTFRKAASFQEVIFNKKADFRRAIFSENADFQKVTFNGVVYFLKATFRSAAIFFMTTFDKEALFRASTFCGETIFYDATFKREADFSEAIFNKEVDFREATFNEEAYFIENTRSALLDLRNINIKGKVRLEKVNLNKIIFIDADLRKIDFINCEWPKKFGRDVLYDELTLFSNKNEYLKISDEAEKTNGFISRLKQRFNGKPSEILKREWNGFKKDISCDKEKIKKVEILYRRLKQKYKEEHDEQEVSNWHYGEKAMFRKSHRWRRFLPSVSTLYWLSSGYGESPVRAGFVFFLLIIALYILFGLTGIKLAVYNSGVVKINEWPADIWNFGYFKATIEYATFESKPTFIPENWFLKIAAKLLIPLQAALFALALRNRFRR